MEEPPHKSSPRPPVGVVQRPMLEVCAGAAAAHPLLPLISPTHCQLQRCQRSVQTSRLIWGGFGQPYIYLFILFARLPTDCGALGQASQSVIQSVSHSVGELKCEILRKLLYCSLIEINLACEWDFHISQIQRSHSSRLSETFRFGSSQDWAVLCIWLGLGNNRWGGAFYPSKVNGEQWFGQLRLWFGVRRSAESGRAMKWQMLVG